MGSALSRRRFLALPLLGLAPPAWASADARRYSTRAYEADVAVLYNVFSFAVRGNIGLEIDRRASRYRVTMAGQGAGVSVRSEGAGIIRDGRFKPTETLSLTTVRGRENRTSLAYDYERSLVEYHSVSYTFLLGRRRQADDLVRLAPGQHVDDIFSAELNFSAHALDVDPDGAYRVTVVRRARPASEGPDDVTPGNYRAEMITLRFHAAPEAATGRLTALVDLAGFSSWARPTQPARVAFGPDRHLESVQSSLILGTTFTLRLGPTS